MARTLHVLTYDYVDDILERRDPHRPGHLDHIARWHDDGRLVMAGALGDPPRGGLFIFDVEDPEAIGEFVAADPYVDAGLVREHRVDPWTVVAG